MMTAGSLGDRRWTWFAAVCSLLVVFVGLDPLHLSIIANDPFFEAKVGLLAHWKPSPAARDSSNYLQQAQILRTPDFVGPESLAFDADGKGPYTGVADGRIMLWNGPEIGWTEFAYTSPNWTRACVPKNPTSPNLQLEHICGRPLGLRFNMSSGDLYIADAYFGLMVVGPEGGLARSLTSEAEGQAFAFTNDLDLCADGFIYFTDSSSKYARRQFVLMAFAWDDSGRLLRYNTATNETKVLVRGLTGPNGVSLSKDESFLLVADAPSARLLRYWLKGSKAGTVEAFASCPGHPDNVRRNEKGEFWVAIHCKRSVLVELLAARPWIREAMARLPIPLASMYSMMLKARPHAMLGRYSEGGDLLQVVEDAQGRVVKLVSEGDERHGKLWVGSALVPQVAVLSLS